MALGAVFSYKLFSPVSPRATRSFLIGAMVSYDLSYPMDFHLGVEVGVGMERRRLRMVLRC
jgi:hypothetical protein